MLYKPFLRSALTLHLTSTAFRSVPCSFASTMASPPQTFKLDRTIFNETLYSHLRDFWLGLLPPGASKANAESERIWYGRDLSPQQKAGQDEECRRNFAHALEAVGPDKLLLPPFESHEKDVKEASTLSHPFLHEVKQAQRQNEQKGSDTLLSLVILLDQISRNIYRDPRGLRLVFRHYDRLAHALVHSSMALSPNPILHPSHRLRPVIRQWYIMPLMHAEHLPSHDLFLEILQQARKDGEEEGNQDVLDFTDHSLGFERMHIEPLKKFGRYPHRNEALGRSNSGEEEEYLADGETFGVAQQPKKGQEGKGKVEGKSEL